MLAGCGAWDYVRSAGRRAVEKREDGTIPVIEAAKGASELPANPGNLNAWAQIGEALAYILFGAGGLSAILAGRRKLRGLRDEVVLSRGEYAKLEKRAGAEAATGDIGK